MAREKHLTNVHIGNFKRFRGLQVDNLGQFNLVVGDNNTGKTSFLEALVLDEECYPYENVKNLLKLLKVRKSAGVAKENTTEEDLVVSVYGNNQNSEDAGLSLHFTYENYQSLVLIENVGVDSIESYVEEIAKSQNSKEGFQIYVNHLEEGVQRYYYEPETIFEELGKGFSNTGHMILKVSSLTDSDPIKLKKSYSYLNFMPFGAGYDNDLESVYDHQIEQSRPRMMKMIEQLKLFIPKVVDLRIRKGEITIYESDKDLGTPLYTYGEGAVKFFRILCYMAIAEGKRLMIDEIDTGIHHTKFVQFWKILIQAAKAYDVQLFATTHNEECLQYYIEALKLEELEEERAHSRVLRFSNHNDTVVPRVYDWEELLVASELNHELRGDWL
ncbi:MAG: ATP/GTP-binding protein [Aureispira sp.]